MSLVAHEKIKCDLNGTVRPFEFSSDTTDPPKQCREKLKKKKSDYRKLKDSTGQSSYLLKLPQFLPKLDSPR